jgi:pimeloyl-ACP methyl ester carboxylesterase
VVRATVLRRGRLALAVAGALAGALAASGCSTPTLHASASASSHDHHHRNGGSATSTTTTTTLPVAPIVWIPCHGTQQCGSLTVPLDYAAPGGPTIDIAVERHLAQVPSQAIGSLIINPGGPGVSGIDDFSNELSVLTPQLLDDFDIVTFDPRGVERSDPVTCGETSSVPTGTQPNPVPSNAAAQKTLIDGMRQFGADCEKASGVVLPYVGTVEVAQDLERLRIALGGSGLNYMGQSYGTLLGLTYAQMFPTHIRAMALDSVIDPGLSLADMTLGQAKGFEAELLSFFSWCASTSCSWRPSGDPTAALLAQISHSITSAAPAGRGRAAGPGEMYDALLDGLYSRTGYAGLARALAADASGNGAPVVAMSDAYNANGSTNGSDAGEAVDCLDHPAPAGLAAYNALAFEFATAAPVFGPLLAWGEAACWQWPVPPTRKVGPVQADGSPPILVIGTTQDPATPYAWAVNVAKELQHGDLLTRVGSDHVAYFYSSCVRGYVENYLVNLATPPVGTTCTS